MTASLLLGALFCAVAPCLLAETVADDFADGNDDGWVHDFNLLGSTGQSWTVANGEYRLQAPVNGPLDAAYVGSYLGPTFTDVEVSCDFTSWSGISLGLAARVTSPPNGGALNIMTGYGYGFEPFAGEMVLYKFSGANAIDLGAQAVSLDPAKDYRFVLSITGSTLHGQVFEIGGGLVADSTATDAQYASGNSGVFGFSLEPTVAIDFTIDSFMTRVPEPSTAALLLLALCARAVRRQR